jgi:mRNA interferase HigB
VRVIARRTLRRFIDSLSRHRDKAAVKTALDAWFHEVRKARWTSTADLKRRYVTASVVTSERIVWNIKGNSYRLVAAVDFRKGIVWIKWIGSHADYDLIDAAEVEHEH